MYELMGRNSMHRKLANVTEHEIQIASIYSRRRYNLAVSKQAQFSADSLPTNNTSVGIDAWKMES